MAAVGADSVKAWASLGGWVRAAGGRAEGRCSRGDKCGSARCGRPTLGLAVFVVLHAVHVALTLTASATAAAWVWSAARGAAELARGRHDLPPGLDARFRGSGEDRRAPCRAERRTVRWLGDYRP